MNDYLFFTNEQGNILVRLLLAHLLSDFVLQSRNMALNKSWFSYQLLLHTLIVYACTAFFTGWWLAALVVAGTHYVIDGLKTEAKQRKFASELFLFVADQLLHILVLILVWSFNTNLTHNLFYMPGLLLNDYNSSLILLGYLFVSIPVGYLIGFATKGMVKENDIQAENNERGGKSIGIYERIIILTFVLMGQYEAIGFLITGKSIIRFVNKDEHIRSEYVLLGTMMSYMFAIVTGVLIKLLMQNSV